MPQRIVLGRREVGPGCMPLVIAEVGINHAGDMHKAKQMIDAAAAAGCECVKFQTHILEEEMIPNDVIPGNAAESIWELISRCTLTADEERELKAYTEAKNMLFLSTPFSRAAAVRLHGLGVAAFKIGSGECNNYPLLEHIAEYGKPVLLSTGMNDLDSISRAVDILRKYEVPFALLHCTSVYPTPYRMVRLGALAELQRAFPDAVIGLSDHSPSIYPCLGAVALGASILERHFTADKSWPGPDIPVSMDPLELRQLIAGSRAIYEALGGSKGILEEELPTIRFAYACVVAIRDIARGEELTRENIWVKRPGTGEIKAGDYEKILGKIAAVAIKKNEQLRWRYIR